MTHRRKPTDAQIVAAIESSGGIILVAAQKLGVNRQSLHRRPAFTICLVIVNNLFS